MPSRLTKVTLQAEEMEKYPTSLSSVAKMGYLGGAIFAFSLLTMLWGLWFWFTPWRFPPIDSIAALDWYEFKERSALAKELPRILTIGGSNGLYGISTAQIERETGIAAVNMCTNSNLDLPYILDRAKRNLRRGDVALLCLEFGYFTKNWHRDVTVGAVMLGDREYFLRLPWFEKIHWVLSEPIPETLAARYQPEGRLASVHKTAWDLIRDRFNDHGDYQGHKKSAQTEEYAKHVNSFGPLELSKMQDSTYWSDAWRRISKFAAWCRDNGVLLVATFPSTVHYPQYDTPEIRLKFDALVNNYQSLDIPILGMPEDFIWDAREFHDTNYHLNEEAMRRRTSILIGHLVPVLAAAGFNIDADAKPPPVSSSP